MEYCARCMYPANARPTIIFDDQGVCSGCRYHESREKIVWKEREKVLEEILEYYKKKAKDEDNPFDCIIPVSGGKDSHYQVHIIKNVYGMNPLLVKYNHAYNTSLGIRNLNNIVSEFGCDLIRYSTNPQTARKISKYMLKKVGDLTWHYHAGIRTFPYQVAVERNIPLVILGEHGFAELTGLVTLEDMVEHTRWSRQEHDMRGIEPHEIINAQSGITQHEIAPYIYPKDEDIERVGVRGIYMSNFVRWNAYDQAHFVIDKYNFGTFSKKRERTFVLYAKTDDHANDVHDYLKYLKFGYGRATDDASIEIRHGRMTREEGIELVKEYDSRRPSSLDMYLKFLGISEDEFLSWVEPMRDKQIWEKKGNHWEVKDAIDKHTIGANETKARVALVDESERTFSPKNKKLYYSKQQWEGKEPNSSNTQRVVEDSNQFIAV